MKGFFLQKTIFGIRQWATRLVYSNRFCKGLYKTWSAFHTKRRAVGRAFSGSTTDSSYTGSQELRAFTRYQIEFSNLPGWFLPQAQAAWDCFLAFQGQQDIHGNMLEIGVWKGKSAALSTLHARANESCIYVDRLMLSEFKETIGLIRQSNHLFLEVASESLPAMPQVMQRGATFRWIHIDGEHSGEAVWRDLAVADELLSDKGMLCIDDFPSCAYPQVNFAVVEFLAQHPHLTMVACGHNKGYICRAEIAPLYLVFIKDELHRQMKARGVDVTIWKSGRPADRNCFGITDRVELFDYRGPDWAPGKIEI